MSTSVVRTVYKSQPIWTAKNASSRELQMVSLVLDACTCLLGPEEMTSKYHSRCATTTCGSAEMPRSSDAFNSWERLWDFFYETGRWSKSDQPWLSTATRQGWIKANAFGRIKFKTICHKKMQKACHNHWSESDWSRVCEAISVMPQLFFQFQAVHTTWILVKRSPTVPKTNKGLELCDNVHCHRTTLTMEIYSLSFIVVI